MTGSAKMTDYTKFYMAKLYPVIWVYYEKKCLLYLRAKAEQI